MFTTVLPLLYLSGLSQDSPAPDLHTFSGRWGRNDVNDTSWCLRTFNGPPSSYPYAVVLTVNDDGSFIGEPLESP
jgi:hypothetical protein